MNATQKATKPSGDTSTKRVGPKKGGPKDEQVKEPKFTPLNLEKAVDANGQSIVNAEGKLTACPYPQPDHGFDGFVYGKTEPLTKDSFDNTGAFLRYQVLTKEARITSLTEQRDALIKRAEIAEKYGDENTRKKVAKVQKLKEQMAELQAALAASGVDVSQLG